MEKKKKKKKIKKPSFFAFIILGSLILLFSKIKFGLKYNKVKIRKKSLIIAPHRSYYDFIFVPAAVWPLRPHIIATTYWFRDKFLSKLFTWLGVIPKDQYKNDVRSIINIGEAFKENQSVLMFPEGQMSPYGTPQIMPQGLDKLIYKFKPNVYFVNTNGAYFMSPKWGKKVARGHMVGETSLIIPSEDLESMSLDEINGRLNAAFNSNNDFLWQRNNPKYKFIKKRKAEGLEHILLYCPKCNGLLPFETKESTITCKSCGYSLSLNKNDYTFTDKSDFNGLDDLFKHNLDKYHEEIDNGLVLEDKAVIRYVDNALVPQDLMSGKVVMNKDTISFIDESDESKNIVIDLKKVINFVITFNKQFEVPTSEKTYVVYPENLERCILYWNYIGYLKENKK